MKCYDKALELENGADAWINKGNIFFKEKKYKEAVNCYDKALEFEPDNAEVKAKKDEALKSSKE